MTGFGESKKRDFISQLIVILEQNSQLLNDTGFDPSAKISQLQTELAAADEAEGRQTEAKAAAKAATIVAQDTLRTSYDDGSATVELIVGLLGKKILWCRKLKNCASMGNPNQRIMAMNSRR